MLAIKKNLKDQTIRGDFNVMMFCKKCGAEYSANAGDYFWAGDDDKFKCCGKTMILVTKDIVYQEV